jgi:hypothetical protein
MTSPLLLKNRPAEDRGSHSFALPPTEPAGEVGYPDWPGEPNSSDQAKTNFDRIKIDLAE